MSQPTSSARGPRPGLIGTRDPFRLHTHDEIRCPLVLEPEIVPGSGGAPNRHLVPCEDCEVRTLSCLTYGQVEDFYPQGRVSQAGYEAYTYVWAHSAPRFSTLGGSLPDCEDARRVARKLWRYRFGPLGAGIPAYPAGLEERGAPC